MEIMDYLFFSYGCNCLSQTSDNFSHYLKSEEMNQIGDKIDINSASCRDININELMDLLRYDAFKFMSWGATGFIVDKAIDPTMLRFKVNGHHHKGHVYIFLNGMDLFDVYLTTLQGKIKDRTDEEGIYCDQLADWIDEKVEWIPEYKS